jgi:serine/threonine protein kinase
MELAANTYLKNGTYRIEKKIGEGGFGITYQSTWFTKVSGSLGSIDAKLPVAIKEFFFEDFCSREGNTNSITILSTTGKEIFSRFKEKLLKEAEILSKLSHPNIVRVIEVFEENNTAYMVMDYIEGDSLKDKIKNEKLPIDTSVEYILQIADALEEVHAKSILHLDLKPSNILINKRDGRAMLIDFGISKRYNDTHEETSHTPLGRSKGYAPFEQYLDKGAASFSPALDVYALGATLYHLVTGVIPVEANERILNDDNIKRPSALNNKITKDLEDILLKALEIKKENRYQTIGAFAQALRTTLSDKTVIIKPTVSIEAAVVNITTKKITENENTGSQPPVKIVVDTKNKITAAAPVKKNGNKKLLYLIAGAAILAITTFGIYYYLNEKDEPLVLTPAQIAERDSLYFFLEDTTTIARFVDRRFAAATLAQLGPIPDSLKNKPNPRYTSSADILNSFLIKKRDTQDIRKTNPEGTELFDALTIKKHDAVTTKVLGTHAFSDQWISWDYFGQVTISEDNNGKLKISGRQTGRGDDAGEYCTIEGSIKIINANHLEFTGTITERTKDCGPDEIRRNGKFNFMATDGRQYWRCQEMESFCPGAATYLDIYFRKK